MVWYEFALYGILCGVAVWIIVTSLDMMLDWFLQRHVRRELDAINHEAESVERGDDGA